MKKIIASFSFGIAFSLMVISTEVSVQQRLTLFEEVTSASCGPCAAANPGFDALLSNNEDKVAVIKYQRGGGAYIDPMFTFNPNQVNSRIANYYGVSSFPNVWMNGSFVGSPNLVTQQTIDNATTGAPNFEINIDRELNEAKDSLNIHVDVTALQDFRGSEDESLRIFTVVIEKEVNYSSPPGTNGEMEFHWVMRKMFPQFSGWLIGKQFAFDNTALDFSYEIDLNEIDPEKLEVVVFLQRYASREVLEASKTVEEAEDTTNTTTGIEQLELINNLSIYPVVAENIVNIQFNLAKKETFSIEIYDAVGQLVHSVAGQPFKAGSHVYRIDATEFLNGAYFAVLKNQTAQETARFMISK